MSGKLPLLSLRLSDLRLQEIILLVQSIPLPEFTDQDLEVDEMDVFSVCIHYKTVVFHSFIFTIMSI